MKFSFLVFIILAGCATIGEDLSFPPVDWPSLAVTETHVPYAVMRQHCTSEGVYNGCAIIDFAAKTCEIWYSDDPRPPLALIKHERDHCLGHSHAGESTLHDRWEQYKEVL